MMIAKTIKPKFIKTSFAFIIAIFLIFIFILVYFLLIPKYMKVYIDSKLSNDISLKIQNLAFKQNIKKLNAKELYKLLNQEFDYISKVDINFLANRNAVVKILTEKPILLLNNNFILTDKAKVIAKDIFKEKNIFGLNKVYIEKLENFRTQENFDCLKKLSQNFFDDYIIKWIDKNNIILVNKKYNNLIIAITSQNIDKSIINKAKKLYKKLSKEKGKDKKVKMDLRFNDRIIFSHLRGVEYEKVFKTG